MFGYKQFTNRFSHNIGTYMRKFFSWLFFRKSCLFRGMNTDACWIQMIQMYIRESWCPISTRLVDIILLGEKRRPWANKSFSYFVPLPCDTDFTKYLRNKFKVGGKWHICKHIFYNGIKSIWLNSYMRESYY